MKHRHAGLRLFFACRFLLFAAACCGIAPTATPLPESTLPLQPLDGDIVDLADYRGRVVLVNFWATWCAPCRVEMPELDAYYQAHQEEGFALLAVNAGESRERAEAYIAANNYSFPVFLDTDSAVADYFSGIRGMPTSFVLDRQGEVVYQHIGIFTPEELESHVTPLLAADR